MNTEQTRLARKNLDRRLSKLDREAVAVPPFGWIRAIREALGMSPAQLAKRMGVSRPRINALEKAEKTDATTLKSLRQAAEAMDCTLVYAFVPNGSLEDIVEKRAQRLADERLLRLEHTMRLENQTPGQADLADERDRLRQDILNGAPRKLWDDT
ncbi:mobile mystery protein A [Hyphomonas atlantica corrig.]|uniref:mobile mystery protein A n=1 Tax=Hyphomonas atlantica TaxID=1280948 RepID=UPI00235505E2|nr:mobile mystery protein A [Hyphomonas atlantica]